MNEPLQPEGNLIVAGVGGQGVILASNIIADVCLSNGLDVKKAEVHGMSQRGGVVTSQVRFGREVHSVMIEPGKVDFVVAFEWAEALRWLGMLREGGVAFTSRERIIPPTALSDRLHGRFAYPLEEETYPQLTVIDAFALAKEAGDARAQGTVLLGALSHRLPFPVEAWHEAIQRWAPPRARAINVLAFDLGRQWQMEGAVETAAPVRPPELRASYQVLIEPSWCKGCEICLDICPERIFALDDQSVAVAVHMERCTGCQLCVKLCPDFAIEVKHAVLAGQS